MSTLTPAFPPTTAPVAPARAWWRTLKVRVAAVAVVISVTGLALATSFVLHHVAERSVQAVSTLEADQVGRIASSLGQRVVAHQNMLRVAAERMPEAAHRDSAAAETYLRSKGALAVNFDGLFIATADGRVLAGQGAPRHPTGALIGEREYFLSTRLLRLPVVSRPLPAAIGEGDPAGGRAALVLTMPVWDSNRRSMVAVLGAVMLLDHRLMLEDLNYGAESSASGLRAGVRVIVTDDRGLIVAHPDPLRLLGRIDEEPGLVALAAEWSAQGRPIEPEPFALHDPDPGRFVAMAGVPGAGWMVFRTTPGDRLLGGLAQARSELLVWLLVAAVVTAVLMFACMGLLLRPLSRLTERARALHDSDPSPDAGWPESASGEIGELAQALHLALRERAAGEAVNRELLVRMRTLLALAPIGIVFTHERRIQICSAELAAMLAESEADLVGRHLGELMSGRVVFDDFHRQVMSRFERGEFFIGEFELQRSDGSRFWARMQGRLIDERAPLAGTLWLIQDVTESRAAQERLSWQASHDPLTRLLNRDAFGDRLHRWQVEHAAHESAALIFLDLDRFKVVNDNAGHAAGDRVLQDVAGQLQSHVRPGDSIARLGGDEFALLLPNCGPTCATDLADRLRVAIGVLGIEHAGRRLEIGASLGIVSIARGDTRTPADWLAEADAACYAAKHAGRDAVRLAQERSRVRADTVVDPGSPQASR
ncbi:MAG: diguanylate cyclase [Rubrivivax sp.]|nr:diguanylate cyclase [Rubrivivax sp.]